jgi:AcrR family transcriptional regulator
VPPPTRSIRGERTREALRRAAQVRFLAQGVDQTSAEQIAADAGVSLRTFYRHFASKRELLFGDYDASLQWFSAALEARPIDEPITQSVLAAIQSFPFEPESMYEIAALREQELDRAQVDEHIHHVQAEFAAEVERHMQRKGRPVGTDAAFLVSVSAQCIAAATFAAVDTWMRGEHSDLEELSRLTELSLRVLEQGLEPLVPKHQSGKIDKKSAS